MRRRPALSATQYGCAQDDVTELGLTDVYWALFYVTVERSAASTFTTPFMSDVGLSLLVKSKEDSLWDDATKIFRPFTRNVWLLTVAAALFVSLALWVVESRASMLQVYFNSRVFERSQRCQDKSIHPSRDLEER